MRSRLRRAVARRHRAQSGFTLIEALAAFAILALALAALLQGVGGAAKNQARADFLWRATRQGQSQLEALGVDGAVPFGETTGAYVDGLVWRLVVEPYRSAKLSGDAQLVAYRAQLHIRRAGAEIAGDSLTLTTIKTAATGATTR